MLFYTNLIHVNTVSAMNIVNIEVLQPTNVITLNANS